MFTERNRQLGIDSGLPLRNLATALNIYSATYCKIEQGIRSARNGYISIVAELLQTKTNFSHFGLSPVITVVEDEHKVADKAFNIAKNVNKDKQNDEY
jgi:hypothetical protein